MVEFGIDVQIETDAPSTIETALSTAVTATLQQEKIVPPVELSLLLADDAYIQQLNQNFRAVDDATDVLSFPAGEHMPGMDAAYLGDIVISVPYAQRQATTNGHPLTAELQLLAIHGTLHLLGHDHAEQQEKAAMWAAQTAVLRQLGLGEIRPSEGKH